MLQSLGNNEQVLLMYLAGELPPLDHQEVEQLLAGDAGLRQELGRLREAQAAFAEALAALDAAEPLTNESIAVRRVGRAIRQEMAIRAARPVASPPAKPSWNIPWWAYPSAVAAAILIGFLIFVGNWNAANHRLGPLIPMNPAGSGDSSEVANGNGSDTVAPQNVPTPTNENDQGALAASIEASFGPSQDSENDNRRMLALGEDAPLVAGSDQHE